MPHVDHRKNLKYIALSCVAYELHKHEKSAHTAGKSSHERAEHTMGLPEYQRAIGKGWEVLKSRGGVPLSSQNSVVVVNHATKEVVLVCRGTAFQPVKAFPQHAKKKGIWTAIKALADVSGRDVAVNTGIAALTGGVLLFGGPQLTPAASIPLQKRIATTMSQAEEAHAIAKELGYTMSTTGHSLGGYVANICGTRLGVPSYNINGPVPITDVAFMGLLHLNIMDHSLTHHIRSDDDHVSHLGYPPDRVNSVVYETGTGHSIDALRLALTDQLDAVDQITQLPPPPSGKDDLDQLLRLMWAHQHKHNSDVHLATGLPTKVEGDVHDRSDAEWNTVLEGCGDRLLMAHHCLLKHPLDAPFWITAPPPVVNITNAALLAQAPEVAPRSLLLGTVGGQQRSDVDEPWKFMPSPKTVDEVNAELLRQALGVIENEPQSRLMAFQTSRMLATNNESLLKSNIVAEQLEADQRRMDAVMEEAMREDRALRANAKRFQYTV